MSGYRTKKSWVSRTLRLEEMAWREGLPEYWQFAINWGPHMGC